MKLFTRFLKKKHYRSKIKVQQKKIWDLEFLLHSKKEEKEGRRIEYDRIMESLDAAKRRLAAEKYRFYTANGDEISAISLPLRTEDIEKLTDKPSDDLRFYKLSKENPDKTICENMQKMIARITPDAEQLANLMKEVDKQIDGYDSEEGRVQGIIEMIDGYRGVEQLLRDHIKRQ